MPGIFGAASAQPRRASAVPLESLGRRLRVQPGLSTRFARSDDGRAVIGAVDLGVLAGSGVPQRADDGSLAVVHGEITNLDAGPDRALELIARYRRDPATLAQLEGSFVAAIWDAERGQLILVNDRFGLRNLYYSIAKGILVFAPLVGPLLDVPGVDDTPDLGAAADLLVFEHVLGPRTLARGVQALPPASLARFENGELHVERYWTPRYRPGRGTLDDYTGELERRLGAAARRAFAGPGRAGLPLSAGLDSRAILAALGRDLPAGTPCFTYGVRGSVDFALGARLAAVVGAPHHAFELAPGYIAARFDEMVALTDGMQLGLNVHATVLQDCARACDLIVLGNGGDCVLDRLWWWNDADPDRDGFQRRMFERLSLGLQPDLVPVVLRGELLRELLDGTRARLAERLSLYGGDTAADVADAFNVGERHWRWVLQGVPAQSNHVEFRQPFYDYRVVDLALEVPLAMRSGRRLHVELINRNPPLAAVPFKGQATLPAAEAIRRAAQYQRRMVAALERAWRHVSGTPLPLRPRLRGFADYEHELRTGSRSIIERYVLSERTLARSWFRAEGLRALAEAHLARRANHARVLGTVATLEHWLRMLEDRVPAAAPATPQAAGGSAGGD